MNIAISQATGQQSLRDPSITYPLLPPLTRGCPKTSNDEHDFPVEVAYDYSNIDLSAKLPCAMAGTLATWAPILPPIEEGLANGVGSSPLIPVSELMQSDLVDGVYLKDESSNPTWSHKDRLNVCTVSAAKLTGAPGIVVASSGNHGASAAAMAARLGLPCIVVMSGSTPPAITRFVEAYGATILRVARDARWEVLERIVDRLGYHPVSNQTRSHTGHAYGPEGYKTIAYEIHAQLGGRTPEAVFVPTGYAELLYGVWKGFRELHDLGVAKQRPKMMACEVSVRGPLAKAVRENLPTTTVPARPTDAYSMATTTSGYRGVLAVTESRGSVILVTDDEMYEAQERLGRFGIWQELSGASGIAGLAQALQRGDGFTGPVVCIGTSSGFKDKNLCDDVKEEEIPSDWQSIQDYIAACA